MQTSQYPKGSDKLEDGTIVTDLSFLDQCDERLRKLYDLWVEKKEARGDGLLPARSAFEPWEMKDILPHIFMVDKDKETQEFRYRLIGTEEVIFRGYDPTGKLVREACAAKNVDTAIAHYQYVFEERNFIFNVCKFDWRKGMVEDQTLFLPTATDGKNVDIALCIAVQLPRHD